MFTTSGTTIRKCLRQVEHIHGHICEKCLYCGMSFYNLHFLRLSKKCDRTQIKNNDPQNKQTNKLSFGMTSFSSSDLLQFTLLTW